VEEAARRADAGDLPTLALLWSQATRELRAERGGEVWALQVDRGAPEPPFAFDDPDQLVLAGTIDDVVVGYARVVATAVAGGSWLAVLTDVFVEERAREVGVGEALLDQAIEWARARGCIGIDSVALPGMRASKNFFEAAGLVARAITVHKDLRS
jgi:GNAT superfamily N-acetyltransferase